MKICDYAYQNNLPELAAQTIDLLRDKGLTVGFAESCTGGLLSSELTKVSGSSDVFWGSVVSYHNSIKENLLNVNSETLKSFGAVSAEVAKQMSVGALEVLKVNVSVAITGIAGPAGGSQDKPVGTVFIAVSGTKAAAGNTENKNSVQSQVFHHDFRQQQADQKLEREDIQKFASAAALEHLQSFINNLL